VLVKLHVHSRAEAIAIATQPNGVHRNGDSPAKAAAGW
jgi:hypothetical protein